jgi:hypothetical protein
VYHLSVDCFCVGLILTVRAGSPIKGSLEMGFAHTKPKTSFSCRDSPILVWCKNQKKALCSPFLLLSLLAQQAVRALQKTHPLPCIQQETRNSSSSMFLFQPAATLSFLLLSSLFSFFPVLPFTLSCFETQGD